MRISVMTPSPRNPRVTWLSRVPTVPASVMTKRRYGNAIVRSTSREIVVSAQPR